MKNNRPAFHPFLESSDKFIGIRGKGRPLTSLHTLMLSPCTCGSTFCFPFRYTNGYPKMLYEGDPTDNVFIKCMNCERRNEARSALESINDWNKSWNALHPDKTYPIYSEYPIEGKEYTQSDN